jgi:hypothetical protein
MQFTAWPIDVGDTDFIFRVLSEELEAVEQTNAAL